MYKYLFPPFNTLLQMGRRGCGGLYGFIEFLRIDLHLELH